MKWITDQFAGSNPRALLFLSLWYFFSGCTLFLNKHIISHMQGDPLVLATSQMLMTLLFGFAHLYYPMGMYTPVERKSNPPDCIRNMVIVGTLRFTTVFLGLVALKFIEVSFTETVKSTAPAFTVILSRIVVGEVTGPLVKLSLIPVMGGLALCSANELSFNLFGFVASLSTNISECSENVCSKLLISGKGHKYSPAELQYFSSLASFAVQLPCFYFFLDVDQLVNLVTNEKWLLVLCFVNGIFFHCQTISNYVLMDYISPVTQSVANTAKRVLLIWLSVIIFGNPVTFLSGLGTTIVFVGVLMYNKAKHMDDLKRSKSSANISLS